MFIVLYKGHQMTSTSYETHKPYKTLYEMKTH